MKKAVLIAEKPSLMKAIKEVYNKNKSKLDLDITFVSFAGHVCNLAPPNQYPNCDCYWSELTLPVMPKWDSYKINIASDKKELVNNAIKVIKDINPDYIINACDSEREGEHIFRLFRDAVIKKINFKGEILRFWNNSLTDIDILFSLQNLLNEDAKSNLREAAFCRGKTDWLIGMNMTIASTLKLVKGGKTVIKIGRIKTPLLHICCEREKAINSFVPSSHYQIKVKYDNYNFTSTLIDSENKPIEFENEELVNKELINIQSNNHNIIKYSDKKISTSAPAFYNLTDIQVEANKKYGFSATKTLEIVQSLYEKKLTSYPRTELRCISKNLANELPKQIMIIKGSFPEYENIINQIQKNDIITMAVNNKKICDDDAVSKAGHTALVITTEKPNLSSLSSDEYNMYKMICIRILCQFMPPLEEKRIEIVLKDLNNNIFKSTYKNLISKGYTVLFENKSEYLSEYPLKENQNLNPIDFTPHEVKATCPSRFTEGELLKIMENPGKYLENQTEKARNILKETKGIGTAATRAKIISDLFDDGYCTKKKSGKSEVIYVNEIGMFIYDNLHSLSLSKVDLTAMWEQRLRMVEYGEMTSDQYRDLVEKYIKDNINEINNMQVNKYYGNSSVSILKCKCPICNNSVKETKKAYLCEKFAYNSETKEITGCPFILGKTLLNTSISEKDLEKLLKGNKIKKKLKKDDSSWEQELFFNKETNKIEFVKKNNTYESTNYKCPFCGEILNKTSWGYGCSGYKAGCKFGIGNVIANNLNEESFNDLLTKGLTKKINGFISKKGTTFNAAVCIDKTDKTVKFIFDNNK